MIQLRMRPAARRKQGFTLIELLVVVAIIAILMSTLLPALRDARKAARAVKCAAHFRSLTQTATLYTVEERGWLAGPNTSGLGLAEENATSSGRPATRWDWVSPVLGKTYGFSGHRLARFEEVCMTALRCPENDLRYGGKFQGPELPMWRTERKHPYVLSYILTAYFHLYPNGAYPGSQYTNTSDPLDLPAGQAINLPPGYKPQIERAGTPARKAYAFEGARYFDPRRGDTYFDYTTTIVTSGIVGSPQGNMASRGPAFWEPNTNGEVSPFAHADARGGLISPLFKLTSLRHRNRMNMAYLDGHVEALGFRDTLDPALYAPTGSTIVNRGKLWLMWVSEGGLVYEKGDKLP